VKRLVLFLVLSCAAVWAQQGSSGAEMQQAIKDGRASLVVINTNPPGASISIDGVVLSPANTALTSTSTVTPTMFTLFKKASPRVLVVTLPGYKPLERRLDPNGSPIAVEAALEPASVASSGAPKSSVVSLSDHPSALKAAAARNKPTPFGFRYGSSKDEVIKELGSAAVVKVSGNQVTFKTAPSPHPEFELYNAFFSPKQGLLKVVAYSRDIATSDDGSELKNEFDRLRGGMETKYGPSKKVDNCKGSDVDCEPQFYMMQLMEKNRSLFALWTESLAAPDTGIVIEGRALGINKGFIAVTYEFPGWNEFVDEQDNKKNSVF
jgi:hypothetical protein